MDRTRTTSRRRITALVASALLAASGLVAGGSSAPAYAAPPANDSIANARTITDIPTRIVQDTSQASSSADDGECVYGDSVWYRFRPTRTTTARAVTIGSDFDTVLAVFQGSRASRTLVACSDDAVGLASAAQVRFVAGTTYWIAVSACCDTSGNGGRSVLTLYRPRPATTTATLGTVETGGVSGRLFLTGTVQCGTPSIADVFVVVSQRVGTMVARGSGFVELPLCGATARPWTVRVDSDTGVAFQEGIASVTVHVDSGDGFDFASSEQTQNVTVGTDPNARPRS
jgi:hypothetical protein